MTPLLDALLVLLDGWRTVFPQQHTFALAMRLVLAQVLAPGCRTISRIIAACGLDQQDWSADYRVLQVRNPKSVPRQPAFVVAIYAMMLLAAQKAYGSRRVDAYVPLPKWRKGAKRPSCQDIISELRREMETDPEKLRDFATRTGVMAAATFRASA